MDTPAVEVTGLTTGYRNHLAIEDITFTAASGRLVGVLGPNGSGKSTILKSLIGLLPPWYGTVRVFGQPPGRARNRMGYVPQAEEVDWDFPVSVRDVVAMGLYERKLGLDRFRRVKEAPIIHALERMGAAQLANRQVGELSGGQQRRVLLARALVRDPDLVLLDEPAAGLDATAEAELLRLLRTMADEGKCVMVATHDIQGVYDTFDDAVLVNRHLVSTGPVRASLTDHSLHQAFGRQLITLQGIDHHEHHVEQSHEVRGGQEHERTR